MTWRSTSHDRDDEALLDAAVDDASTLLEVPLADLPTHARALVQEIVTTRRPDDTWPPAELLHEVLQASLDAFDERLRIEGRNESDISGDPRWISAWRECVQNPTIFESLLHQLRSEEPTTVGVPSRKPPADLRLLFEP